MNTDTDSIIQQLGKHPPVTSREERRLLLAIEAGRQASARLAHDPDDRQAKKLVRAAQEARQKLILANGRLVIKNAAKYTGRGVPLEDLCQEGVLGLMRAIKKFRYGKGAEKLSTYATWWIRQSVSRAVSDQGRTIRLPVHQHDRVNKIKKVQGQLEVKLNRVPTLAEVAEQLGLPLEKVAELLRLSRLPVSLDEPLTEDSDTTRFNYIPDDGPPVSGGVEYDALRQAIEAALGALNYKEAKILTLRFGLRPGANPLTLEEVGRKYGLTRERIRQIEGEAKEKLMQNPNIAAAFQTLAES